MIKLAKSLADSVGLLDPLRKFKRRLIAEGVLPWTPLVPEQAFSECVINAIGVLKGLGHQFGDYIEFGVSRGTSMACVYHALAKCGVKTRLIGFDSFEGLAADTNEGGWTGGQFASTEGATRRYLTQNGVRLSDIILVKGWFSDTATAETRAKLKIDKASIFLVDSDTYQSSVEALAFAATVLGDRMVVLFDDWGWSELAGDIGQKEAFAAFLEANSNITAEPLPAYRAEARVFLLTRTGTSVG